MRAFVALAVLCLALPVAAQTAGNDRQGQTPLLLDATLIVGEPPTPGFRQAPRAPEPGKRRPMPLRADFRSSVLASAGAL